MANETFEYVWNFLRENNCVDAAKNITNGMRCTICRKVMINAHNGQCGCRYCLECVTHHLNGESKNCPGKGDYCKKGLMVIDGNDRNVYPDNGINHEISRLVVKCPLEECEFKGELGKMEEHQRVCEKCAVHCPYCVIKCPQSPLVIEKMNSHLLNSNELHAKLLVNCINEHRTEIDAVKGRADDLEEKEQELQDVAEQQAEQIEQLNQDIQALKDENKSMKEQIDCLLAAGEKNQKESASRQKQISDVQKKCSEHNVKLADLEKKAESETNARREDMDGLREKQTRCDDAALRVHEVWINVERKTSGHFMWRIDNWSERRRGHAWPIFSEPFCLHEQAHRLCLSMGLDDASCGAVGSSFYVGWHVARGPFDDKLCWPLKCSVTVSLLNQQSRDSHTSFATPHNDDTDERFQRPTKERNDRFDSQGFVTLSMLSQNPDICKDDRILIRCTVQMTSGQ